MNLSSITLIVGDPSVSSARIVVQMSKLRTFQELTTKAHDMEMTIANHHGKSPSSYEFKKDKGETKKNSKPSKA